MLNWGHYLSLQKTFVKVPCRHTQFIDFSPKMSYNNLNRRLYVTRGQKLEKYAFVVAFANYVKYNALCSIVQKSACCRFTA